MAFQVEEKIEVGLGIACFKFNILSDCKGVTIWLTDYRLVNGKKILKKWSNIGDDGSFIKREKIEIPDQVIESVKRKITNSIFVN